MCSVCIHHMDIKYAIKPNPIGKCTQDLFCSYFDRNPYMDTVNSNIDTKSRHKNNHGSILKLAFQWHFLFALSDDCELLLQDVPVLATSASQIFYLDGCPATWQIPPPTDPAWTG